MASMSASPRPVAAIIQRSTADSLVLNSIASSPAIGMVRTMRDISPHSSQSPNVGGRSGICGETIGLSAMLLMSVLSLRCSW